MKRIIASVLLSCLLSVTAFAGGNGDVQGGARPVVAPFSTTAPITDGVIGEGEYGFGNGKFPTYSFGKGLSFRDGSFKADKTEEVLSRDDGLGSLSGKVFCTYDGDFVYTAFEIKGIGEKNPVKNKLFFNFTVDADKGEDYSATGVEIYVSFSLPEGKISAVSGVVTKETPEKGKRASRVIDPASPSVFTDSKGRKFDAEKIKNECLAVSFKDGTFVFEAKISSEELAHVSSDPGFSEKVSSGTGEINCGIFASFLSDGGEWLSFGYGSDASGQTDGKSPEPSRLSLVLAGEKKNAEKLNEKLEKEFLPKPETPSENGETVKETKDKAPGGEPQTSTAEEKYTLAEGGDTVVDNGEVDPGLMNFAKFAFILSAFATVILGIFLTYFFGKKEKASNENVDEKSQNVKKASQKNKKKQ